MGKTLYSPGDRVRIIDDGGPARAHVQQGDILTIKKKMNDKYNTYYFEEIRACLAASRFVLHKENSVKEIQYNPGDKVVIIEESAGNTTKIGDVYTIKEKQANGMYSLEGLGHYLKPRRFMLYHPSEDSEPGGTYNGWPNRETDEAALIFFNDQKHLKHVEAHLVDAFHCNVDYAALPIKGIQITHGDMQNVCVRSILEEWMRLAAERGISIPDSRRAAIMYDLKSSFDYVEPPLDAQAQAIADRNHFAKKTCQEIYNELNQEEPIMAEELKEKINKIETVHLVNGKDIRNLNAEQRIALIVETEAEINGLESINTKSKTITNKVAALKDLLKNAVELFDKES